MAAQVGDGHGPVEGGEPEPPVPFPHGGDDGGQGGPVAVDSKLVLGEPVNGVIPTRGITGPGVPGLNVQAVPPAVGPADVDADVPGVGEPGPVSCAPYVPAIDVPGDQTHIARERGGGG